MEHSCKGALGPQIREFFPDFLAQPSHWWNADQWTTRRADLPGWAQSAPKGSKQSWSGAAAGEAWHVVTDRRKQRHIRSTCRTLPTWLSRGFWVGWEVVVLETSQLTCRWTQVWGSGKESWCNRKSAPETPHATHLPFQVGCYSLQDDSSFLGTLCPPRPALWDQSLSAYRNGGHVELEVLGGVGHGWGGVPRLPPLELCLRTGSQNILPYFA